MDKKWHYTEKGEYPELFGEYKKLHYPQIPCLVQEKKCSIYGIRYWNCIELCWDDEECDDYACDKDCVRRWMYIGSEISDKYVEMAEKRIKIENMQGNLFDL